VSALSSVIDFFEKSLLLVIWFGPNDVKKNYKIGEETVYFCFSRRYSSRSFPNGYLVTTSFESLTQP
jgi:hypothetical protein